MYTEDLIINDNAQGEEIEHIRKVVPDIGVPIFSRTFRIKAIRLRNSSRFMVPSYQMHAVWVSKLETNKKGNRFDAEHAPVYIVAYLSQKLARCQVSGGVKGWRMGGLPRKR